jgi:uncharacterized integral membrane protein (TIGR00698 family)
LAGARDWAPWRLAPGLLACAALAAVAFAVAQLSGLPSLNPVVAAMLLGLAARQAIGARAILEGGVCFAVQKLLRLAVALLGLRVALSDVAAIGWPAAAMCVTAVASTWLFTVRLGERMGVEAGLARLIATGTSICGASAVIAANGVIRASEEETAYAVATVTVFGTVAMLAYPMLGLAMGLSPQAFGLWAGASIHEVGQVVAAGGAFGSPAVEPATISKLVRVLLLAPLIVALARAPRAGAPLDGGPRLPVPWFILGFLGCVVYNSRAPLPPLADEIAKGSSVMLLAVAMAGLGLNAKLREAFARGPRPLILAGAASTFIGLWALAGAILAT